MCVFQILRSIWILGLLVFSRNLNANDNQKNQAFDVCSLPRCHYQTIKQALLNAPDGATLNLGAETFYEHDLLLEKTLALKGQEGTIIDAEGLGRILVVNKTAHVSISNITFKNTGYSYIEEIAAIKFIESSDCLATKNTFVNTTYGIFLEKDKGCIISGNTFLGQAESESIAGDGIHAWSGSHHVIRGNHIEGHRDGIYLEFVHKSYISDNLSQKNIRYGMHFMSAHETSYERNSFINNNAGVAVMYSQQINMLHNVFADSRGTATYGLLLKDIYDSNINYNDFRNNTVGIFMEGSNRSRFLHNQFLGNGWGLKLNGSCDSDLFENNNFMQNTFDVATNTMSSENTFRRNFWSRYDGYDLDRDGIGDIPFHPVRLSAIIIERVDSSYVLLNSFMFDLLDRIEQALPEIIPAKLLDEQPLIKPVAKGT